KGRPAAVPQRLVAPVLDSPPTLETRLGMRECFPELFGPPRGAILVPRPAPVFRSATLLTQLTHGLRLQLLSPTFKVGSIILPQTSAGNWSTKMRPVPEPSERSIRVSRPPQPFARNCKSLTPRRCPNQVVSFY